MDPVVEVEARPAYMMLVIVCSVVGIGILFLSGIAFMVVPTVPARAEPPLIVLAIFIGLGAASVSAAVTVKRRFVASALRPRQRPASVATSPVAPDLDEALAGIRVGIILACAFSEVPAVLGLAYLVLGGSTVWAPVFFGGALVSWALSFPRPSEWKEWLSALCFQCAPERVN